MTKELGTLSRVELRTIWQTEDRDFTPWLAQEENLKVLSDTIGLDLELEAVEKDVGPFRADILCKNTEDDSWVLIENQLEKTDHKHLGQLLTYAAGLDAVNIIWIAEKITEEHRSALDWLNEITDNNFRFFGLELELWQINDSPPAPKFNIASQPNDWKKTYARVSKGEFSNYDELRFKYWVRLSEYLIETESSVNLKSPKPEFFARFGRLATYAELLVITNKTNKTIAITIHLFADKKEKFDLIYQQKNIIEEVVGESLDWESDSSKKRAVIKLEKPALIDDENDWAEQHEWLKDKLEKITNAFSPILNGI